MEDIRIIINKSSRLIKSISKRLLGNDGENLQENLVFSFEDEFVNGQARLEYVLPDDTGSYLVLTKVDDKYQIPVRSLLLQEGTIHFQLVITEGEDAASIPVFKSNIFKMKITSSLNTVEIEAPAGYASWLELANTKLNQMDNFNISATKSGNTATISVTNRLNQTTSVDVVDGADFQYDWQGTSLGVKNSNEQEYEYVNLKGNTGDKGDKGDKPVKGVDYFTSQDIADMEDYVINSSTSAFNQNATQKTNAFNSNATSKTDDFNTNATTKTTAYNDNAIAKTTAFDENAQDKIDEYDEHVQELTDRIEFLEDEVNDLSDNQLIAEEEGTEVYVSDGARARLNEFRMTKESTQETTTGKNLCSNKANNVVIATIPAGTYTFSLFSNIEGGYSLKNGSSDGAIISGTNYISTNTKSIATFTINEETSIFINGYSSTSGKTFGNDTIDWQLESGSTATPYEPYTGGQPSPSPDYPQEVNVVEGYRNLWDFNNQNFVNQNLFSISRTSDGIIFTSTGSGYAFAQSSIVLEAGTYNFNYIIENGSVKTSGNNYSDSKIFTLTETTTVYFRVYKSGAVSGDIVTLKNISLYKGTSLLPDIPYGNNYVNVEVRGKNLFNKDKYKDSYYYNSTGTTTDDGTNKFINNEIPLFSTYVISFSNIVGQAYVRFVEYDNNNTFIKRTLLNANNSIITISQNTSHVIISVDSGPNSYFVNLQIENGLVATSYEPYVSTNAQIPLNGNYVAGIGDYKDEIIVDKFGKCYLNKKIGKVVLDGTENWDGSNITVSGVTYRQFYISFTEGITGNGLSNHFTYNVSDIPTGNHFYINTAGTLMVFPHVIINNVDITATDDFKSWLSTHNTDVYYVLATENLIDLNYIIDLKTFKGINNITNSEEADMQIKYVQDINTVISNITNSILEIGGGN